MDGEEGVGQENTECNSNNNNRRVDMPLRKEAGEGWNKVDDEWVSAVAMP